MKSFKLRKNFALRVVFAVLAILSLCLLTCKIINVAQTKPYDLTGWQLIFGTTVKLEGKDPFTIAMNKGAVIAIVGIAVAFILNCLEFKKFNMLKCLVTIAGSLLFLIACLELRSDYNVVFTTDISYLKFTSLYKLLIAAASLTFIFSVLIAVFDDDFKNTNQLVTSIIPVVLLVLTFIGLALKIVTVDKRADSVSLSLLELMKGVKFDPKKFGQSEIKGDIVAIVFTVITALALVSSALKFTKIKVFKNISFITSALSAYYFATLVSGSSRILSDFGCNLTFTSFGKIVVVLVIVAFLVNAYDIIKEQDAKQLLGSAIQLLIVISLATIISPITKVYTVYSSGTVYELGSYKAYALMFTKLKVSDHTVAKIYSILAYAFILVSAIMSQCLNSKPKIKHLVLFLTCLVGVIFILLINFESFEIVKDHDTYKASYLYPGYIALISMILASVGSVYLSFQLD